MTKLKYYLTTLFIITAPALYAQDKVALIDTVSPENAKGDVAKVYNEIKEQWQMVPNPIKLYSGNPELLRHKWDTYQSIAKHETVDARLQTVIRMLVSKQHDCEYCIGINEAFLINMFKMDPEKVMAMKKDPSAAPLPEKEKGLLDFVLKATKDSKSTTKADIDSLHKLGWNDAEIFFATSYAAEMVASDILINAFHVAVDY